MIRAVAGWLAATVLMLNRILSCLVAARGDEGHGHVALTRKLASNPAMRRKVSALLAADTDPLAAHSITAAATWPVCGSPWC